MSGVISPLPHICCHGIYSDNIASVLFVMLSMTCMVRTVTEYWGEGGGVS